MKAQEAVHEGPGVLGFMPLPHLPPAWPYPPPNWPYPDSISSYQLRSLTFRFEIVPFSALCCDLRVTRSPRKNVWQFICHRACRYDYKIIEKFPLRTAIGNPEKQLKGASIISSLWCLTESTTLYVKNHALNGFL